MTSPRMVVFMEIHNGAKADSVLKIKQIYRRWYLRNQAIALLKKQIEFAALMKDPLCSAKQNANKTSIITARDTGTMLKNATMVTLLLQ